MKAEQVFFFSQVVRVFSFYVRAAITHFLKLLRVLTVIYGLTRRISYFAQIDSELKNQVMLAKVELGASEFSVNYFCCCCFYF